MHVHAPASFLPRNEVDDLSIGKTVGAPTHWRWRAIKLVRACTRTHIRTDMCMYRVRGVEWGDCLRPSSWNMAIDAAKLVLVTEPICAGIHTYTDVQYAVKTIGTICNIRIIHT